MISLVSRGTSSSPSIPRRRGRQFQLKALPGAPQELQARRENLGRGQKSLDHQIERLTQAYLSYIIQLEEFQRRRSVLEEKLRVLEEQGRQLQAQVERKLELAGLSASIESFRQRIQAGLKNATFENKRQLVELLIDRVAVMNEEVDVRNVTPTGPDGEKIRFCHLRKGYFDHPSSRQQHKASF